MTKAEFMTYKGVRILDLDVRQEQEVQRSMDAFRAAQALAIKEAPKSVRLITDVTGAHYDSEGVGVMKAFSKAITPYVKASAAVGVTGIKQIILQSLIRLSGRNIKLFDTREEALEWLVDQ